MMSCRHKGVQRLFTRDDRRGVPAASAPRLRRLFDKLDAATEIRDMDLPGFQLPPLKGDRKGTWAVTVTGNWRLTFTFATGKAADVDLEDYH